MYVYIIRSVKHPLQTYVGSTQNLKKRLIEHNSGKSPHTSKYKPWYFENAVWFKDEAKAFQFERYLKGHSGLAFRAKHF